MARSTTYTADETLAMVLEDGANDELTQEVRMRSRKTKSFSPV